MATQVKSGYDAYVDLDAGTVDREIFSDEAIYKLEMERIFGRTWNFMCHETQIAKPGDFFLNFIGEESVIATRDRQGNLQVFLNSCRHRGNAVCRAESGNTRAFLCTYHGWTYGLDGKLMGVPGFTDLYHEELDKEQWGLVPAGKVQSYKGFVFATMDPDAPDLEEFLGPVGRMGLDQIALRGMVAVDGVQKNVLECNWKIAVDNIVDWYHVDISHASAVMSSYLPRVNSRDESDFATNLLGARNHRVVMGDYGHVIGGPRVTEGVRKTAEAAFGKPPSPDMPPEAFLMLWRTDPAMREQAGDIAMDAMGHPNIFPNTWVASFGNQICLRLPKGPNKTELWWFTFVDPNAPPQAKAIAIAAATRGFGPAGMLEQDDGENWEQSTRATQGPIASKYPLNYQMNFKRGEILTPPEGGYRYVDTHISEHAQLWMYQAWADWMNADSWDELKANRTALPEGKI